MDIFYLNNKFLIINYNIFYFKVNIFNLNKIKFNNLNSY